MSMYIPMRRGVSAAPITRGIEHLQEFVHKPVVGLMATDGVVYSPIATVGTTAVEVFSTLLDIGVDLKLLLAEVGLTQKFTNKVSSMVGSLLYYWQLRQENVATVRGWLNITGTMARGVPSGVGSLSEDTFSGYADVGSLPEAPIRARLMAIALGADALSGQVKNSSYVKLVGAVIPGN